MLASFASTLGVDLDTIREDLGEFVSTVRHDARVALDVVGDRALRTGSALNSRLGGAAYGADDEEWEERLNQVQWEKELEANVETMLCVDDEDMAKVYPKPDETPGLADSPPPASSSSSSGTEPAATNGEAAPLAEPSASGAAGEKSNHGALNNLLSKNKELSSPVDALFDVPLLTEEQVSDVLAGSRGDCLPNLYKDLVPARVTHEDFVRRMNYHRARIIAETLDEFEREILREEEARANDALALESNLKRLQTRVTELESENTALLERNRELEQLVSSLQSASLATSALSPATPATVESNEQHAEASQEPRREESEEEEEGGEEAELVSASSTPAPDSQENAKEFTSVQPSPSPESTASAEGWETWE